MKLFSTISHKIRSMTKPDDSEKTRKNKLKITVNVADLVQISIYQTMI